MTRDSHGNTPLHLLGNGSILPFIFEMLEDVRKGMSLLTARNHNGDSLLHVIEDIFHVTFKPSSIQSQAL